jgi:hypothetical protein
MPIPEAVPIDPLEMAPLRASLIDDGLTEAELDAETDSEIDAADSDEEEGSGTLVALLVGGVALGLVVLFLTGKK